MFRDANFDEMQREYDIEVAAGKIANASAVTVYANVINVAAATPMLAWELQIPYVFQTAAVAMELVSSSASDAAAGTGARSVVVTTLDGNYNQVVSVITPTGTTPVPIPGTHLHHNSSIVIDSGSNFTNVGNITIRKVSGAVAQGYIAAGIGISRQGLYTVPAGKIFMSKNFFFCHAVIGVTTGGVQFKPFLRFPNGTIFQGIWQNLNSNGIVPITLPVPFTVPEKTTFGYNLDLATTSTGTFAFGTTGVLRNA
jgi:hypothetical protein